MLDKNISNLESTQESPVIRDKWIGKSCEVRLKAVNGIFVSHSFVKVVLEHIGRALLIAECRNLSSGALITAASGAGKSTLIKHLHRIYPDITHQDFTERPVVDFKVPKTPNPRQMGKEFLKALGDPTYNRGDAGDMQERIKVLIQACKTKIIAIDDFQDVPARRSAVGIAAVGDWVRDILEMKCKCILLVFGTADAAVVIESNQQLARRMMTRFELPVFTLETSDEQTSFRKLLRQIDMILPLARTSKLDLPDTAVRIFRATGGNFDYLMKLLCNALIRACSRGDESLTLDDLRNGFEDLHQVAARNGNPFEPEYDGKELNQPGQIFYRKSDEFISEGIKCPSKGKRKKS